MKNIQMIPALTLAMAMLGQNPASAADEAVVAKVGSREVKASEVRPYLADLRPAERDALLQNKAELARFVRLVLLREAVLQDASGAGWEKKPEVIAALARVRDQYLVESYLAEVSKVPDGFPSEDDLRKAYEGGKEQLQVPKRFELSQIFIAADAGDKAAAKKRADEIAAQLKASPGDFGKLAKANSNEAASAPREGKIGWLTEDQITPEIRKAVAGLSKGQTTPVVEGAAGYHIVRVDDVREAGTATFDEVRQTLTNLLRQQRAEQNRDAHIASLVQRQPVSVNELALESLKPGSE